MAPAIIMDRVRADHTLLRFASQARSVLSKCWYRATEDTHRSLRREDHPHTCAAIAACSTGRSSVCLPQSNSAAKRCIDL